MPRNFHVITVDALDAHGHRAWLYDLDGVRPRVELLVWQSYSGGPLSISRDGRTLAVAAGTRDQMGVYLVDVASGRSRLVYADGKKLPGFAVLSPDGRRYAFQRWNAQTRTRDELWIGDVGGGDPRPYPLPSNIDIYHLRWSSDGRYLALTGQTRSANDLARVPISVIDTTAAAMRAAGTGSVFGFDWHPQRPDLLIAGASAGGGKHLFIYDAARNSTTELIQANGGFVDGPVWSPLGDEFLLVESDMALRPGGTPAAAVVRNATGARRTVFTGAVNGAIFWSQDGSTAFVTTFDGLPGHAIRVVNTRTAVVVATACSQDGSNGECPQ